MSEKTLSVLKAREELWQRGIVHWLLYPHQKELYDTFTKLEDKILVFNCSRRLGKSFLLSVIAIEKCLQNPNILVKYCCARQVDAKNIIRPLIREIIQTCPEELKPVYKAYEKAYVFANGSRIELSGLDGGRAESLRGGSCSLALVDEAGLVSDLKYIVRSIILPTTTTTKGKIILASTPPKSSTHEYVDFVNEARIHGNLVVRDIFDNKAIDALELQKIIDEYGGVDSVDFRREFLCVDEDTLVKTSEGYKKIRDIIINDYVFTHEGTYQRVKNVFRNLVSDRKIYKVKTSNNLGITLTEGHKLLVTKTNHKRDINCSITEWTKVEDIKHKPSERIYLKIPIDKSFTSSDITLDKAYIAGWYVAEGHVGKYAQQAIFSLSVTDPVNELQQAVQNTYGKQLVNYGCNIKSEKCFQWYLNKKEAKEYLQQFGTHSTRKKVIKEIKNGTEEIKREFLRAYFRGDGHLNKERHSLTAVSVSLQLLADVSDMLLSMGIGCQIQYLNQAGKRIIQGIECDIKTTYVLSITGTNLDKYLNLSKKSRNSHSFVKDGYFYSRIKHIELVADYNKDYVYDIEVENNHSYVGLHSTFHNCQMITDVNRAVVPEFTHELQKEVIKEWVRPPFYDSYVSMDLGLKDLTVVLFAYFDYRNDKVIIEDEFCLNGQRFTITDLADGIRKKEEACFTDPFTGETRVPKLRVSDNELMVLSELNRKHNLTFLPTRKDDSNAALHEMREMIKKGKVIIHPRCRTLITHLEAATWNKARTSYDRSPDNGHYDACFTPEMTVITSDGVKEIQNVKKGDLVLTHTGCFKPVLSVLHRPYEGDILKIKAAGRLPILCTPEHKFWASTENNSDWVQAKDLLTNSYKLLSPKEMKKIIINNINSLLYSGDVYTLEVEDDHSYTINGVAVKNCDALKYLIRNINFNQSPYPTHYGKPNSENRFEYGKKDDYKYSNQFNRIFNIKK